MIITIDSTDILMILKWWTCFWITCIWSVYWKSSCFPTTYYQSYYQETIMYAWDLLLCHACHTPFYRSVDRTWGTRLNRHPAVRDGYCCIMAACSLSKILIIKRYGSRTFIVLWSETTHVVAQYVGVHCYKKMRASVGE